MSGWRFVMESLNPWYFASYVESIILSWIIGKVYAKKAVIVPQLKFTIKYIKQWVVYLPCWTGLKSRWTNIPLFTGFVTGSPGPSHYKEWHSSNAKKCLKIAYPGDSSVTAWTNIYYIKIPKYLFNKTKRGDNDALQPACQQHRDVDFIKWVVTIYVRTWNM